MTSRACSGLVLAAATVIAVIACTDPPPEYVRLLADPDHAPSELRDACELVAAKCTQCHTIERVAATSRLDLPALPLLVRRMRLKPGSGITQSDSDTILHCLLARATRTER